MNAQRSEPHAYALLGNLGTRPRTTYLAASPTPIRTLDMTAVMTMARGRPEREAPE